MFQGLAANDKLLVQISAEAGPFLSTPNQSEIIIRTIGRLWYKQNQPEYFLLFKSRLAPELYGPGLSLYTLKFSGEIAIGQNRNSYFWQARFSNRLNYYHESGNNNILFSILYLGSRFVKKTTHGYNWQFNLDYVSRDISRQPSNKLDSFIGSIGAVLIPAKQVNIGLNFYAERFHIKRAYRYDPDSFNDGWRIGPNFSYRYQKNIIVDLSYQMIFEYASIADNEELEHRIQITLGKYIWKNLSAFLNVNYLQRSSDPLNGPELSYHPLNNENWIYTKIAYDLSSNNELFTKIGYIRDDLLGQAEDISGWQAVFGLSQRF